MTSNLTFSPNLTFLFGLALFLIRLPFYVFKIYTATLFAVVLCDFVPETECHSFEAIETLFEKDRDLLALAAYDLGREGNVTVESCIN
jgi:hypothetical protein